VQREVNRTQTEVNLDRERASGPSANAVRDLF
jgi:hypothetical protein